MICRNVEVVDSKVAEVEVSWSLRRPKLEPRKLELERVAVRGRWKVSAEMR